MSRRAGHHHRSIVSLVLIVAVVAVSCSPEEPAVREARAPSAPEEPVHSTVPVVVGEPIDVSSLAGRLVLSSEDDIYVATAGGSGLVVRLTDAPGPEFDPAWSPDGSRIVYRDSRRGINEDDEIFVMEADGSGRRNLTRNDANDWGPDWSPDGSRIVFNSDRDGMPMGGFLVEPDGSNLRRIPTDTYLEYPAWSPDGTRIAFMGHDEGTTDYDIFVVNVDGTGLVQLTDHPADDGWPAWSPDGTTIAFSSTRGDCDYGQEDCRVTGDVGPHHDVWVVGVDGTGLRRVTPEFGQFVTWSPDGDYLLVAGFALYVIRPDGTGRATVAIPGLPGGALFPDWIR